MLFDVIENKGCEKFGARDTLFASYFFCTNTTLYLTGVVAGAAKAFCQRKLKKSVTEPGFVFTVDVEDSGPKMERRAAIEKE